MFLATNNSTVRYVATFVVAGESSYITHPDPVLELLLNMSMILNSWRLQFCRPLECLGGYQHIVGHY